MSCHVYSVGANKHTKPIDIKYHAHTCYELILYTKGHGYVYANNTKYYYKENTLILIPPNTVHNEVNQDEAYNIFIGFHGNNINFNISAYQAENEIVNALKTIISELAEKKSRYQDMMDIQLQEILILLDRKIENKEQNDDFFYILNYIGENIALPLKVDSLAKMSNYSYDYFRHLFKERVGLSPKEYIIRERLIKARGLLNTKSKSITEIAYECGFYDSSSFCKLYKKHFGCSPSKHISNKRYN